MKLVRDPCSASSDSAQAMSAVLREPARPHHAERAERRHELRAVDEREAFLRCEPRRFETGRCERIRSRQQLAVVPGLPFADQRQGEMGERREVATRTDRAAARHVRQHAAHEALEQELDRLDPRARISLRQSVPAQEHRGANDLVRIRISDTAGMAAQQPQLQLLRLLLGNRLRDEPAEAGVDPVGVLVRPVRGTFDELAGGAHLRAGLVRQHGLGGAEGDRPDVVDPEILSGQADRGRLSHRAASLAPGRADSRAAVRAGAPPARAKG